MAPSYFIEIEGIRYDRELIEMADQAIENNDKDRLSLDAVKVLFKPVLDGNLLSENEEMTLIYIREVYRFSKAAEEWLRETINPWIDSRKAKKKRANRNRKRVKPLTSITAELEDSPRKVPKKRPPIPYQQGYYRNVRKINGKPSGEIKHEDNQQPIVNATLPARETERHGGGLYLPKSVVLLLLAFLIPVAFFTGRYSVPVQTNRAGDADVVSQEPAGEKEKVILQEVDSSEEPLVKEQKVKIAELEESIVQFQQQVKRYENQPARIKELETAIEESRREVTKLRISTAEKAEIVEREKQQADRIKELEAAVEESRDEIARLNEIHRTNPQKPPVTRTQTEASASAREQVSLGQNSTVAVLPEVETVKRTTEVADSTVTPTIDSQGRLVPSPKQSKFDPSPAATENREMPAKQPAKIDQLESLVAKRDETINLLNLRLFRLLEQEQNRRDAVEKDKSSPKEEPLIASSENVKETSVPPEKVKPEAVVALATQTPENHLGQHTERIEQQEAKIAVLEASLVQKNLQIQEMDRKLSAVRSVKDSPKPVLLAEKDEKTVPKTHKAADLERERLLFNRLDQQQVRILALESALKEKSSAVSELEEQLEEKTIITTPERAEVVVPEKEEKVQGTKKVVVKQTSIAQHRESQTVSEESLQQKKLQQREIRQLKTDLQKSHLALQGSTVENRKLQEKIVTLQTTLDAKPSVSVAQPVRVVKELTAVQKKIAETMERRLEEEFKNKNIQFDKERLLVTFLPEQSFFKIGDVALKQEVKQILRDFFPKLVDTIKSFDEEIVQIQFQGHSSSYWQKATNKTDAYLKNLGLSILRAESALRFCLELEEMEKDRAWLRKRTVTAGFSDNRPVLREDNQEDPIRSRRITIAIGTLNE